MKKCSNTDHPHCTFWVLPGEQACAGGHEQPASAPTSYELLSAMRSTRAASPAAEPRHVPASPAIALAGAPAYQAARPRPQLHISGFDPRKRLLRAGPRKCSAGGQDCCIFSWL